jgi:hypothetical protein
MLIETGDLTNAQAVDIVHTVGVVKVEVAEAAGGQGPACSSPWPCWRA